MDQPGTAKALEEEPILDTNEALSTLIEQSEVSFMSSVFSKPTIGINFSRTPDKKIQPEV